MTYMADFLEYLHFLEYLLPRCVVLQRAGKASGRAFKLGT
jgi:hypothetical protein